MVGVALAKTKVNPLHPARTKIGGSQSTREIIQIRLHFCLGIAHKYLAPSDNEMKHPQTPEKQWFLSPYGFSKKDCSEDNVAW